MEELQIQCQWPFGEESIRWGETQAIFTPASLDVMQSDLEFRHPVPEGYFEVTPVKSPVPHHDGSGVWHPSKYIFLSLSNAIFLMLA